MAGKAKAKRRGRRRGKRGSLAGKPPSLLRAAIAAGHRAAGPLLLRLPRMLAVAAGAFLLVTFLWVLAYRFIAPPGTHLMMSEGGPKGAAYTWVPLERISPHLVRAVIGAEDARFCSHWGIDWAAVEDALREAENGDSPRGASTISQQTAKNAFLWKSRSWVRKGLEAYFTLVMELLWPKRRILEVYLNIVEFGPGVFGAEAASHAYFKKPAEELTRREASLMAAVLPNPKRFKLSRPSQYVRTRAAILDRRAGIVRRDGHDDCVLP